MLFAENAQVSKHLVVFKKAIVNFFNGQEFLFDQKLPTVCAILDNRCNG